MRQTLTKKKKHQKKKHKKIATHTENVNVWLNIKTKRFGHRGKVVQYI